MKKVFFLAVLCLTQFASGSIIQIHQPKDQNLNQINTEFFVSSFMGRKTLKTQGELNPFTVEVDTDEQTARSGVLSWSYNPIEQSWEKVQAAQRQINNPFPEPPTIVTFNITERLTISGLSGSGSFTQSEFTKLNNFQFPLLLQENSADLELFGTYSIRSYDFSVDVPFFYTITSNPISTRGLLRMDNVGPQIEESYYVLSPSHRTLYNGTVEGYSILVQLNQLNVPVTVPEPSALILTFLALIMVVKCAYQTK